MTQNIIVFSDTHCGCQVGLFPPEFRLDNGNIVKQSKVQRKLWALWEWAWNEWVPMVTKKEDYVIVNNGDTVDGKHHETVTQITQNITDQVGIAEAVIKPLIKAPRCAGYYQIRGTEAHVGKSGQAEEGLAKALGAEKDEIGNSARWEMWMRMGKSLTHFSHHIGTTQSTSYESTSVHKELVEAFVDAGRWNNQPPDCVVRSHRHRQYEIKIATRNGYGISLITPSWQLKTPHTYRFVLGRSSTSQIGLYLIRYGDEDGLYTRFWVKDMKRPKEVRI